MRIAFLVGLAATLFGYSPSASAGSVVAPTVAVGGYGLVAGVPGSAASASPSVDASEIAATLQSTAVAHVPDQWQDTSNIHITITPPRVEPRLPVIEPVDIRALELTSQPELGRVELEPTKLHQPRFVSTVRLREYPPLRFGNPVIRAYQVKLRSIDCSGCSVASLTGEDDASTATAIMAFQRWFNFRQRLLATPGFPRRFQGYGVPTAYPRILNQAPTPLAVTGHLDAATRAAIDAVVGNRQSKAEVGTRDHVA